MSQGQQKKVQPVLIDPPEEGRQRRPSFAGEGEKKTRYSMPNYLASASPVGYRERVRLSAEEADKALELLSLERPTAFGEVQTIEEAALFEESCLGIMKARQSTNYQGHHQLSFGPRDSQKIAHILRTLEGLEGQVLDDASYTHVVLSRPYRTPFTMLLTIVGHKPVASLLTVPKRLIRKKLFHEDDIPSVGYLQQLHVGILADAMERATVIASAGERRANIFSAPFCGDRLEGVNRPGVKALEEMCGVGKTERARGWRIALVAQVGQAVDGEQIDLSQELSRKLGANFMAFRSERIVPGDNADDTAPAEYQEPQDMVVPDELTVQAGRAAYNAFAHWTGCEREHAKELMMLERIDVLTANGEKRIKQVQTMLNEVSDRVIDNIPKWVDWPVAKAFSRAAEKGRKAFGLAGQRIYIGGLSQQEIDAEGLCWEQAVRAVGACAARSGLVAEIMGVAELPDDCDLLAGLCLMAGPVNQNDIGKAFFGHEDLLSHEFPDRDPTSLLVWTLKAKTVADPIGNEEQLLNEKRQGGLVDLRPGPHEVADIVKDGERRPMRQRDGRFNDERAFYDVGNFATSVEGREIPGNRGAPWPTEWRSEEVW